MPTLRSTNSEAVGQTEPMRVHNPPALVPILPVASGQERERRHLLFLFFVSYIATLAVGLAAVL